MIARYITDVGWEVILFFNISYAGFLFLEDVYNYQILYTYSNGCDVYMILSDRVISIELVGTD